MDPEVAAASSSSPLSPSTLSPPPASSTGTTPPPASPLDAGAFPHLLDVIIENAPLATLMAFRLTSSTIRDRVDKVLFHHLSLWPVKRWDLPGLPVEFHSFLAATGGSSSSSSKRVPLTLNPHWGRRVRVVTFPVAMVRNYLGYDPRPLARLLPNIRVVRLINPNHQPVLPLAAPVLVVFLAFIPLFETGTPVDSPRAMLTATAPRIPPYVERLVLTVRTQLDDDDWSSGGIVSMIHPQDALRGELTAVVVIFDVASKLYPTRPDGCGPLQLPLRPTVYSHDILETVSDLVETMVYTLHRVRYTLVDVHRMTLRPRRHVETAIARQLQSELSRGRPELDDMDCRLALQNVEFLSSSEYRTRVGDAQFVIETDE